MAAVVGAIIAAAIIGPLRQAFRERTDTLLEKNLSAVVTGINTYYRQHNSTLPKTLDEITVSGDGQKIISQNIAEYIPEGSNFKDTSTYSNQEQYGKYQLCVTFVGSNNEDYYTEPQDDEYEEYVSLYYHPEGRVCYKIRTSSYNY